MQVSTYLEQLTGRTPGELFGASPLVVLARDPDSDEIIVAHWDVPGVDAPSSAEIAAALSIPEPEHAPEPTPPPSSCSKLGLKRAFDEKGLWTTVRAMLASNADLQEEWDLAIEVRISDRLVKIAVADLAQIGIPLSPADVQALVTRANELVA